MKIEFNIEKKHIYILSLLAFFLGAIIVYASVNPDLGFRPLSQISKSWDDLTSVDENADGIIDEAEQAEQVNINIDNQQITLQQAIDQNLIGAVYSCHWEKSWARYPGDAIIPGGEETNEKTSCDVGQCQFKFDNSDCGDPSSPLCNKRGNIETCGAKSANTNEYLYCCE